MSSSGDKNKGEFLSPECKEGPVQDRSCTDLLCLIVFTVTFVGLFGVAIYGFHYGQPTLLYTPMDPDGTLPLYFYIYLCMVFPIFVSFSIFLFSDFLFLDYWMCLCYSFSFFHFNIIHFAFLSILHFLSLFPL